ncbi:MAG: hypothetical protein KF866_02345 [Phycisphaeraceae bacterium]|nr:hypothetical protein [Phycisphaeraceae bacterium]MCW5753466.1 hypothetical protein [Phycisphaeraceae bacterium]
MDAQRMFTGAASQMREPITLSKGRHQWIFRCQAGQERLLIDALADLAERDDCPLDWFDASLVMHELDGRADNPASDPGVED